MRHALRLALLSPALWLAVSALNSTQSPAEAGAEHSLPPTSAVRPGYDGYIVPVAYEAAQDRGPKTL